MKITKTKIFPLFIIFLTSIQYAFSQSEEVILKIGDKAPDFTITNPAGKEITLYSLKGKIILLDFWASWCLPCREANLDLVPLYHKFQPIGFEIFSVSLDNKKEAWVNAIKNDKLSWDAHGSDLGGWESKIAQLYGVAGIPATFIINENGIIVAKDVDDYDMEKKLNYLFFEQVHFYPHTATSKLYFTGKAKFQIENGKGEIILKGKGEEADITGLLAGEYILKYEDKTEKFIKKISTDALVTFYPQRVDDEITLSKESSYEIYSTRAKILKKGKGLTINVNNFTSGIYYISIEGSVSSFYKK